jgi:hypothetical protein
VQPVFSGSANDHAQTRPRAPKAAAQRLALHFDKARRGAVVSDVAGRLAQLLRLALSTDKRGESAAAVEALKRTLRSAGFDAHDVADALVTGLAPPKQIHRSEPDWRSLAGYCADHAELLSEKELDFIVTISRYRAELSPKQTKWLRDIVARLREAA